MKHANKRINSLKRAFEKAFGLYEARTIQEISEKSFILARREEKLARKMAEERKYFKA